jgi:transposase-like protein
MLNAVNAEGSAETGSLIDEIVREGARRMLAAALEAEVNAYLAQLADVRGEVGAVEKITGDEDVLVAFYDYPAEYWIHLRTTNPIESTFATVHLRTSVA